MSRETEDAQKVDRAILALGANNIAEAASLLREVIANTPADYVNSSEAPDGSIAIKFWDQHAFVHYVMWQKTQGIERGVQWALNAYPRAHYYVGFIGVKVKQYEFALEYLERGQKLEPTNPKFNFEKAQALVQLGEREKALALYEAVTEIGPYVSVRDLAIAKRGCGFVLIEMRRLDEAEQAFNTSLAIEPGNSVALHELRYIEHLRKGGNVHKGEAVPTQAPNLSQCSVCGKAFTTGVVRAVDGIPRGICNQCNQGRSKG
jgi:tetratricopeptide (TPR) repeat protein